jgi:hypothetical protein
MISTVAVSITIILTAVIPKIVVSSVIISRTVT